ncbi:MAG TPA: aminotransferase class V-fold PLP-dependent enzyme [Gemmatimonadales bacterium]
MATRRDFLSSVLAASATIPALRNDGVQRVLKTVARVDGRSAEDVAEDEDFWLEIQQAFTLDRTLINLNNGGVCPSPRVVLQAMERYLELSNQAPVYHMWRLLEPDVEIVRRELAAEFGCDVEEMAITRNASEALEICQLGIEMQRGDEVLTTDQDYGRMLTTWNQRARREGIVINTVSFPDPPPSLQYLVDMFARALTPKTKVLHFCHITNLSGQIFPVREICRMARARGVQTIVDGAHAFAHFPFTYADLECDYYGTSLHKWLLAPIGTGFLFVRKERIASVWPLMPAAESMDGDIRKFEEIGTHPAANHNAIAEALAFHRGIGGARKAARLRFLRDRWMRALEGRPGVQLHTSFDPAQACGLANVGIDGVDPGALTNHLWQTKRIIVTPINHEACRGIRVTPNVYTTLRDVDVFLGAMEEVIADGSLVGGS